MHNVFAFTERVHPYPGYISVNRHADRTTVTVRSRGHNGAVIAEVEIPCDEQLALAQALQENVNVHLATG